MRFSLPRIPDRFRILSGSVLKVIALALMTADHIGATMGFVPLGVTLRLFGRMAFPIFAFLLAEGYAHTGNPLKYAGRLLVLAVISELPFNLLMSGKLLYYDNQNVMWTLFLSLCAMYSWDRLEGRWFLRVVASGAITGLGWVFNTDYFSWGVFLPLLFHILKKYPTGRLFAGAAISLNRFQACSYLFLLLYNGERGFIKGKWKWAAYLYYPAHILAIWGMGKFGV